MSNYVIRSKHDKENPYSVINKKLIRNGNLSFKARGFLIYLLSFPDNWKIQVSQIEKDNKEGEKAIYNYLNELKEHGYVKFVRIRDENKSFSGSYYEYSEDPVFLNEDSELKENVPHRPKGDVAKADVEKGDITEECSSSLNNVSTNTIEDVDSFSFDDKFLEQAKQFVSSNALQITDKVLLEWKGKFKLQVIIDSLKVLKENKDKANNHEAYMNGILKKLSLKPTQMNAESNKDWSASIQSKWISPHYQFEVLHNRVEINPKSGQTSYHFEKEFSEAGFQDIVENELRKKGFIEGH